MRRKNTIAGLVVIFILLVVTMGVAVLPGAAKSGTTYEGCSPGYWKHEKHFDSWVGYSPADDIRRIFGVRMPGYPTLLEALRLKGGGANALLRHATAALLNAANPDVTYCYTEAQVIEMVQTAFGSQDYEATKDLFEAQNELGCPLN